MGRIMITVLALLLTVSGARAMNATASAACHGNPGMQETSNYVFCQPELNICVEEVRFYEHIKTANCPDSEISSPKPECCQVQDQQCYWSANYTVVQKVHDACNETRSVFGQCTLPAENSRQPPTSSLCSNDSSIRVVMFTCRNDTCPDIVPDTTTTVTTTTAMETTTPALTVPDTTVGLPPTTDGQTQQPEAEAVSNTPAIVGGSVAGGIALIVVIAIAVVTCRKSRSQKYEGKGSPEIPEIRATTVDSAGGTYNGTFSAVDEKTHM